MANSESVSVYSFSLDIIIHSLTILSSHKKFFIKLRLTKANEVQTEKFKKSKDLNVVFFESQVKLDHRSATNEKPNLEIELYEFREDHAYHNGSCQIDFHDYYDKHTLEKDLKLHGCTDTDAALTIKPSLDVSLWTNENAIADFKRF